MLQTIIDKLQELYYKIHLWLQRYGLIVTYLFISLFLLICLASCKTVEVQRESVKTDTLYVSKSDTLIIQDIKRDTIRTVDSVYQFIWQKNDTVYIKERVVNNHYNSTNNNYNKEQVKVDTVYQVKEVENIVKEKEKLSKWDKLVLMFKGSIISIIALALILLGLWIWSKKRV